MGIFSNLFGCGQKNDKDQNGEISKLEEITSRTDTSEGFSDIFLKIISDERTDTTHIYIGMGLYNGKTVGLKFELASNIPPGITAGGEINVPGGFLREGAKFTSLGAESDELIRALGVLYKTPIQKPFSKRNISATVFSLNQKVTDLDAKDYYKFKLFFNEDGDEESYGELYLNIDTNRRIVELHEKDQEYRLPLITTLTE